MSIPNTGRLDGILSVPKVLLRAFVNTSDLVARKVTQSLFVSN
jgi:hypothetical protein